MVSNHRRHTLDNLSANHSIDRRTKESRVEIQKLFGQAALLICSSSSFLTVNLKKEA